MDGWDDLARTFIVALIGAGGATFVWTITKSLIALRDNTDGREDRAVARLERYERGCREELDYERRMSAYWCRCTGILQHTLAVNGIPMPNMPRRPADIDEPEPSVPNGDA